MNSCAKEELNEADTRNYTTEKKEEKIRKRRKRDKRSKPYKRVEIGKNYLCPFFPSRITLMHPESFLLTTKDTKIFIFCSAKSKNDFLKKYTKNYSSEFAYKKYTGVRG